MHRMLSCSSDTPEFTCMSCLNKLESESWTFLVSVLLLSSTPMAASKGTLKKRVLLAKWPHHFPRWIVTIVESGCIWLIALHLSTEGGLPIFLFSLDNCLLLDYLHLRIRARFGLNWLLCVNWLTWMPLTTGDTLGATTKMTSYFLLNLALRMSTPSIPCKT